MFNAVRSRAQNLLTGLRALYFKEQRKYLPLITACEKQPASPEIDRKSDK